MPPKKTTATSHDSATGPALAAAVRRSSRGKSAEPQPSAKEKGKAKALETVEETGSDDTPHVTPKDVGEAPTTKERKKGMTLEEYFGPGVDLNQPLYKPHGKWAYTYGNDFKEVECIKRLSSEFSGPFRAFLRMRSYLKAATHPLRRRSKRGLV